MSILPSVIFIGVGIVMAWRPDIMWDISTWLFVRNEEPSKLFLSSSRVMGCLAAAFGAVSLIYLVCFR